MSAVVVVRQTTPIIQVVATRGPQGMQGPEGPPGDQGEVGADANFTHEQAVASNVWTIVHNMGFRPGGILIFDSAGTEVEGEVSYPDANTVEVTFVSSFGGVAYLS